MRTGPISNAPLTAAAVAIVWLSLGGALALLRNERLRAAHGAAVVCVLVVLVLYANILRERTVYGDVHDYIRAAQNLIGDTPLHRRYLYPPLLATLLAPLLPLGETTLIVILWSLNLISLGFFALFLILILVRYGFGPRLSALVTFAFLMINVPLLRTLGYIQVNIHVANLILLVLLCYPRLPAASAIALALAVHIKVSPLVLALPFILQRDWRWVAWFVATTAALAVLTALPYGWSPFFDFLHNVQNIYDANGLAFRENSVDSLFRSFAHFLGLPLDSVTLPILLAKSAILGVVLIITVRAIRNTTFTADNKMSRWVHNAAPALMMFMLLGSPLLWEHHPVFVALPYLLMLKRLASPAEWVVYGTAIFLEYQLPTFDFFPWSFGRLLSPLMLLGLMLVASRRSSDGDLYRLLAALGPEWQLRADSIHAAQAPQARR